MMSYTGGIGRAGGDGDAHSPTSALRSATMPSNGARSVAFSRLACASPTVARACPVAARAASQRAAVASRWLRSCSRSDSGMILSSRRFSLRFRSRWACSAVKQASCAVASALVTCSLASARLARRSLSTMRRRTSPSFTETPLRGPMYSTWPPICGLILARRRAVTVPALLLLTVSSTVPRATL
jgi:hypothetical protein